MKPFNLKEALQGKPVRLRNGLKAIIYYDIPEDFKLINGLSVTYPIKGMTLDANGIVVSSSENWLRNGQYSNNFYNHDLDIIGMYEEDISSLIKKAYKEKLPLRTKNGGKVYIATILDLQNPMNIDYPVIAYDTNTSAFRYTLDGKFVDRYANLVDIIGLYEEED